MKLSLLFLIHFAAMQDTVAVQDSSFYTKLVDDFGSNYLLIIHVKTENYTGKTVIGIADLIEYLHFERHLDMEKCKSSVKKQLINKDTLTISTHDFEVKWRWAFDKLPTVPQIDNYAFTDKDKLIQEYFYPDFVAKETTQGNTALAIIAKLFEWRIPMLTSEYSGDLMIPRRW
jgi:hypothetical protein